MRATLVKIILRLLSLLPLRCVHALGTALGMCFWILPTRIRRVTAINIRLCFPNLSNKEQDDLVRRNLIEVGKTVVEVGPVWYWSKPRLLGLVATISGADAVIAARKAKRPIIFAGPHIGNWELVGLYLADRYDSTMMYRPPRLEALEKVTLKSRERFGGHLVRTNAAGVKRLYHALDEGGCVGILPDQDPSDGSGVFAPFFGIQAYTMTMLPRLARKTGAAVFFIYAQRLEHNRGYHLHIVPAHPDIAHVDPRVAATHLNAGVEQCVRAVPDQYQWGYKRFKTRPEGETKIY